jgi:hypothetical protein
VREEKMGSEHRLGASQVRVGGHESGGGALGPIDEGRHQARDRALERRDPPAQVQPEIQRYLLVARPSRVQPLAHRSRAGNHLAFDERVNVLVVPVHEAGIAPPFVEDADQRRHDRGALVGCQHTSRLQRLGPRDAARHVVFEQATVERKRAAEVEGRGIGLGVEAPGPEGHGQASGSRVWGLGFRI